MKIWVKITLLGGKNIKVTLTLASVGDFIQTVAGWAKTVHGQIKSPL